VLLRLSPSLVASVLIAAVVGCGTQHRPPAELVDGSAAVQPKVPLQGIGSPVILTRVKVTASDEVEQGSPEARCLGGPARGGKPIGDVVVRIGVWSASVTFRETSSVGGCDGTGAASASGPRWCGGSYGRLVAGRLRDPRLDLAGCRTANGRAAAFAWVDPGPRTRYVVVREPGYAEAYPIVHGLPVRIATTSHIASEPLGASFEVFEHDATGRLLRRYRLEARPAG
jgi:hypothetical protein